MDDKRDAASFGRRDIDKARAAEWYQMQAKLALFDELKIAADTAARELRNIAEARRFDKWYFDNSGDAFADWAQSRALGSLAVVSPILAKADALK